MGGQGRMKGREYRMSIDFLGLSLSGGGTSLSLLQLGSCIAKSPLSCLFKMSEGISEREVGGKRSGRDEHEVRGE